VAAVVERRRILLAQVVLVVAETVQHRARLVVQPLQTQAVAVAVEVMTALTVTAAQAVQALLLFATPAQFNISLVAQ
jgi:hypothetical protein